MSVFETHVLKNVNQYSPVFEDTQRVVKYGKDGEELVSFEPIDYKKIIESHGTVEMWSLDAMLKAGINPDTGIHTGLNSRIEGVGFVNDMASQAEAIVSDVESSKNADE